MHITIRVSYMNNLQIAEATGVVWYAYEAPSVSNSISIHTMHPIILFILHSSSWVFVNWLCYVSGVQIRLR